MDQIISRILFHCNTVDNFSFDFSPSRRESWSSALTFCEDKGASLPVLNFQDDMQQLTAKEKEDDYVVHVGLQWVITNKVSNDELCEMISLLF